MQSRCDILEAIWLVRDKKRFTSISPRRVRDHDNTKKGFLQINCTFFFSFWASQRSFRQFRAFLLPSRVSKLPATCVPPLHHCQHNGPTARLISFPRFWRQLKSTVPIKSHSTFLRPDELHLCCMSVSLFVMWVVINVILFFFFFFKCDFVALFLNQR